jgi:hypothetical protein
LKVATDARIVSSLTVVFLGAAAVADAVAVRRTCQISIVLQVGSSAIFTADDLAIQRDRRWLKVSSGAVAPISRR